MATNDGPILVCGPSRFTIFDKYSIDGWDCLISKPIEGQNLFEEVVLCFFNHRSSVSDLRRKVT